MQKKESAKKYHRDELDSFCHEHSIFIGTLDGIESVIENAQILGGKICEPE